MAAVTPQPRAARPQVTVVGSAFAGLASLMFFSGLVGIYLRERALVRGQGGTWLSGDVISLRPANMMAATLLLSGFTLAYAIYSARHADRPACLLGIGITLMLGIAYINQATLLLAQSGLTVTELKGALVWALTGSHAVMALVAMIYVALMGLRVVAGQFMVRPDGLYGAASYWYVMTAVYGVIWYAVFVTK